jgi:hypothetical protein
VPRAPLFRKLRDGGAARIPQPQQLRAFVESLAGGIVEGLPKKNIVADAIHAHQLRVTARDEKRDERELRDRRR